MICLARFAFAAVFCLTVTAQLTADDWARFRGPNGSGISTDKATLPTTWSEKQNLLWKAALPGPGSSSPIVVRDRVFVTSWTGYAADDSNFGSLEELKRHVICLDRKSGKILWNESVAAALPEDSFRGMFAENGYATHTPVSDGENVYVFFGKSGVHAYTLDGKKLWSAKAGTDRDRKGWGSASSPILHGDAVIVTAAIESQALIAFDKKTGKELWKTEADGFNGTWGTPVVVGKGDAAELVLGVPYEIWSINPSNGKLKWYAEALQSSSMCSSVVTDGKALFAVGGREGGSVAVKAGGKGDVTKSHTLWTGRDRARVGTPVVQDGLMYWISSGVANCIDTKTGEKVYQERLDGARSSGGGGRRGGGNDYSSPVVGDGKLFYVSRSGATFVIKMGRDFEQLATNRFDADSGDHSSTPAISDGQLFIRSSRNVYCIAKSKASPKSDN